MSYPEFLIDKRVVQRNIAKGIVDAKEYKKLLEALPDVSSNAEPINIGTRSEKREDGESAEG
jgi:hypothetical protein